MPAAKYMPDKSTFEKYLAGEPLTDELRILRDGQAAAPAVPWPTPESPWPATVSAEKTLTMAERALLHEAKANGVLATLMHCAKRALQRHIQNATIDSENDPLARSAEISRQWAYVAMYRRAALELEQLIDAEIKALEGERNAGILEQHPAERATR